MTREEAIALANTKWWENKTAREIVEFQINEEKLCMPFDLFHKATEEFLQESVYTHQFGDRYFWDYVKMRLGAD